MPVLPRFKSENYPALHVLNFGYEIEGAFNDEFSDQDEDGEYYNEHYRHDGSVSVNADDCDDGEISSPRFRIDPENNSEFLQKRICRMRPMQAVAFTSM